MAEFIELSAQSVRSDEEIRTQMSFLGFDNLNIRVGTIREIAICRAASLRAYFKARGTRAVAQ